MTVHPQEVKLRVKVYPPTGTFAFLDALARDLRVGHSWRDVLYALANGLLVITSASRPPTISGYERNGITLTRREKQELIRMCSAYELFSTQQKPSISLLLAALAAGTATLERRDAFFQ